MDNTSNNSTTVYLPNPVKWVITEKLEGKSNKSKKIKIKTVIVKGSINIFSVYLTANFC